MCLSPVKILNPNYRGGTIVKEYHHDSFGRVLTDEQGKPRVRARHLLTNKLQDRLVLGTGRDFFKDESKYMLVPCGCCPECVAMTQDGYVQRAQSESFYNYDFFITLTFDDAHLPRLRVRVPEAVEEVRECLCPYPSVELEYIPEVPAFYSDDFLDSDFVDSRDHTGDEFLDLSDYPVERDELGRNRVVFKDLSAVLEEEEIRDNVGEMTSIPYADVHLLQLLMKRIRDNVLTLPEFAGRSMRYMAVSELGKEKGRPHFHIKASFTKLASDFINGQVAPVARKSLIKPGIIENMERILQDKFREYWAVNVGTRKNPVYEPLFTYHQKYVNGKLYKNFDCHFVDPENARKTAGTDDISYYVTKYALKDSTWEHKRKAFLFARFPPDVAAAHYRTIRSRLLVSKGYGLNANVWTERHIDSHTTSNFWFSFDRPVHKGLRTKVIGRYMDLVLKPACQPFGLYHNFARIYRNGQVFIRFFVWSSRTDLKWARAVRHLDPCPELCERIKNNSTIDAGKSPLPVFIDPNGKHKTLTGYYRNRPECYDYPQFFEVNINVTQEMQDEQMMRLNDVARIDYRIQDYERKKRIRESRFDFEDALTLAGLHNPINNPIYE